MPAPNQPWRRLLLLAAAVAAVFALALGAALVLRAPDLAHDPRLSE